MKLVYFVSVAGEQKGPFGVAELRRRSKAGEFPGGSLYWREGWVEWQKLNELSEDALVEMLVAVMWGMYFYAGYVGGHDKLGTIVVKVEFLLANKLWKIAE